MKKICVLLSMIVCGLSLSSAAFDFSEADRLFALRENSLQNIADARAIYQRALKEAKGDELVHAVHYLGKLAYYEGELLTAENDHSRRVEIFQQCQDDVEAISTANFGSEVPVYYYWKGACTALWGKSANSFAVLSRVSELRRFMQRGIELAPSFEGGGIHRVVAGVYMGSKMLRFVPGLSDLYDPNKALEHANKAIALGPDYYNAYIVKAQAMRELGEKEAGSVYLKNKKAELESRVRRNSLPKGIEPECKKWLEQMKTNLANW